MDFKIRFAGSILNSYNLDDIQQDLRDDTVKTVSNIHILAVDAPSDISNRQLQSFNVCNLLPILTIPPKDILGTRTNATFNNIEYNYKGFYTNSVNYVINTKFDNSSEINYIDTNVNNGIESDEFLNWYLNERKISEAYIPFLNARLIQYGYLDPNVIAPGSITENMLSRDFDISDWLANVNATYDGNELINNTVSSNKLIDNTIEYPKYKDYSIGYDKLIEHSIKFTKFITPHGNVVSNPVPSYYTEGNNTLFLDTLQYQGGANKYIELPSDDYDTSNTYVGSVYNINNIFSNCENLNPQDLNFSIQLPDNKLHLFYDVFKSVGVELEFNKAIDTILNSYNSERYDAIEYRYPVISNDNIYATLNSLGNIYEILPSNKHEIINWSTYNTILGKSWTSDGKEVSYRYLAEVVIDLPNYFNNYDISAVQGTHNTYGMYQVGSTRMTKILDKLPENVVSITPHVWREVYIPSFTEHSNNTEFYRILNDSSYEIYNKQSNKFESLSSEIPSLYTYYSGATNISALQIQSIEHNFISNTANTIAIEYGDTGIGSVISNTYSRTNNKLIDVEVDITNYLPYIDNRDQSFKSNIVFNLPISEYGVLSNIRFTYNSEAHPYLNSEGILSIDVYGQFYKQETHYSPCISNVTDLNNINTPFMDTTIYSDFILENTHKNVIVNGSVNVIDINSSLPNYIIYGTQSSAQTISNIVVNQNNNMLIPTDSHIAFMKSSINMSNPIFGTAFNANTSSEYRVVIEYSWEEKNTPKTYSLGSNEGLRSTQDWVLDNAIDSALKASTNGDFRLLSD